MEGLLQLLLLLAYLAIGLMSITVPTYAISVCYLPQEEWESEKERKKRIKELRAKIFELTVKLKGNQDDKMVAQLREQVERYEGELKGTKLGVRYLTAKGAVLRPLVTLVLALLSAGSGIHFYHEGYFNVAIVLGIFSGLFSAGSVFNLYKTIAAVEYAALRPARTIEFEIAIRDGETRERIEQIKFGEQVELWVSVVTEEADVENFVMFGRFPLEWEIVKRDPETIISTYRDYTIVMEQMPFLPKNIGAGFAIYVTPKKIGRYYILVRICGKGIYAVERLLAVEVVKKQTVRA